MAVRKALRTLMARQVMLSLRRQRRRPLRVHQPHPRDSAHLGIPVVPVDQGHRPVIILMLSLIINSGQFIHWGQLDTFCKFRKLGTLCSMNLK